MSQLSRSFSASNPVSGFQPSIGQQVTPINNKIYALGDGVNITTNASGNTVFAQLNNAITITSATIGNVRIGANLSTISGNLEFSPVGSGKIKIPYATESTVAVINNFGQIVSSNGPIQNGQVPIGRTNNTPLLATLTAGSGISITNGPGSITISADSSTSGNAGALQWSTQTWTGSGNRTYTAFPNNGYFANSTIGTLSSPNFYCPSSPIRYTLATSDQWNKGDMIWFANRNKGNFSGQLLSDQYLSGSQLVGAYYVTYPIQGACISSGSLDASIASGAAARSLTRSYGVSTLIYIGTVQFSTQTLGTDGNMIGRQFNNVFILVNTMGAYTGCGTCLQ